MIVEREARGSLVSSAVSGYLQMRNGVVVPPLTSMQRLRPSSFAQRTYAFHR